MNEREAELESEIQVHMLAAAYIGVGLVGHTHIGTIQDRYGMGQLELVTAAVRYAPYINVLLETGYDVMKEYPGVGEYEVTEPFGEWFGTMVLTLPAGEVPSEKACCDKLRDMVFDFFTRSDAKDEVQAADLTQALAAVPLI